MLWLRYYACLCLGAGAVLTALGPVALATGVVLITLALIVWAYTEFYGGR